MLSKTLIDTIGRTRCVQHFSVFRVKCLAAHATPERNTHFHCHVIYTKQLNGEKFFMAINVVLRFLVRLLLICIKIVIE